jgi:YHS domain-containing protein
MGLYRPRARRFRAGVPLCLLFLGSAHISVRASEGDPGAEPGPITWRTDYARALDEAKTRNHLVWIQFTGPWCPNCTRMEQDSFPHPAIRAHAERSFVPLKLQSDVNEELALGFGLSGLPATVILTASREVYVVRQGYLGPDDLGDLLREAAARHTTEQENNRRIASAKISEATQERLQPNSKPSTKIKTETHVALSGYCPVSLVSDRKLVPGQVEYTATHEGRLYRFANMLTFNLFRRDPDRFVPVNNGNCPVTQVELGKEQPGNPRFGVLYQGRLYLCATDADRKQFFSSPDRYAAVDVAEQGLCPHCLADRGERVPGDPRCDLTREGRRYWFPDPTHREAFEAASAESTSRR